MVCRREGGRPGREGEREGGRGELGGREMFKPSLTRLGWEPRDSDGICGREGGRERKEGGRGRREGGRGRREGRREGGAGREGDV